MQSVVAEKESEVQQLQEQLGEVRGELSGVREELAGVVSESETKATAAAAVEQELQSMRAAATLSHLEVWPPSPGTDTYPSEKRRYHEEEWRGRCKGMMKLTIPFARPTAGAPHGAL